MKTKLLSTAVISLSLMLGQSVFAQPRNDNQSNQPKPSQGVKASSKSQGTAARPGSNNHGQAARPGSNNQRQAAKPAPGNRNNTSPNRYGPPSGWKKGSYHQADRYKSPHGDLRRGQVLPAAYRAPVYAIDDWRGHGLYEPPRDHRWVWIDGQFVLIAAATGIIATILLN